MSEITVIFRECIQDSQEYGSDDENMVSRIWVEIELDGQRRGDFIVDLKQVVGSDFETGDIEVGPPKWSGKPYDGPFNHNEFSQAAAKYYRLLVGSSGRGIRLRGQRATMTGNRFILRHTVTLPIAGEKKLWKT